MAYQWTCPFCQHPQTIVVGAVQSDQCHEFGKENADGRMRLHTKFVACSNPDCQKATISAMLESVWIKLLPGNRSEEVVTPMEVWRLVPPSDAKVLPAYVPKQIRADYEEACLIRDPSPKASATLSRRCLQGIIRDFWSITKGTLKAEIDALEEHVGLLRF